MFGRAWGLYGTKVSLLDSSSGKTLVSFDYKYTRPIEAEFSRDEKKILINTDSMRTSELWDAQTGQMLFSFSGHSGKLSADGTMVGTQLNGDFKLWDALRGSEIYTLKSSVSLEDARAFDFSPDSSKLVVGLGSPQKGMYTYRDLSSGKYIGTLKGPESSSPRFSADGERVAADSDDGRLFVWNLNEFSAKNPIVETSIVIPNAPYWESERRVSQLSPDGLYVLSTYKGHGYYHTSGIALRTASSTKPICFLDIDNDAII